MIYPGAHYKHPRYRTERLVLSVEGHFVRCQERDEHGFQRVVMPFVSQMERWIAGAVVPGHTRRHDESEGHGLSSPRAYYNEIDKYCVQWLKNLIAEGLIPAGDVDDRPIQEVKANELNGYTQAHFFAGLGGWAYAARLAGWPDERELWTGSCPCQPFSVAGRRKGVKDDRHLWPNFYRVISGSRPAVVMGEQTALAPGYAWLDGVFTDLETQAYTGRAVDIPACSVNAPHIRSRLYWVAKSRLEQSGRGVYRPGEDFRTDASRASDQPRGSDAARPLADADSTERRADAKGRQYVDDGADARRRETSGRPQLASEGDCGMGYADGTRWKTRDPLSFRDEARPKRITQSGSYNFWDEWQLVGPDPDGKYRRVKPGVRLLASRVPARVAKLRAFGNAICPELAAEVIRAFMESEGIA